MIYGFHLKWKHPFLVMATPSQPQKLKNFCLREKQQSESFTEENQNEIFWNPRETFIFLVVHNSYVRY